MTRSSFQAGGELSLAWLANSMPVTATSLVTRRVCAFPPLPALTSMSSALRPVRGIDRIPSRTIRVDRPTAVISRLAVRGRPEGPRSTPRDCAGSADSTWLGPRGRKRRQPDVSPLRRAEVIVRPV